MTITLYAQPYDISASGFFFENAEDYERKAACNINYCGAPVEEYEIQFIDGEDIDAALAEAWQLNQVSFADYLEAVGDWDEDDKIRYIIAVGECCYSHEQAASGPDEIDIDLHECDSLKELAEQFVDEGLFGEIPERLQFYLDYEAIARDLSADYAEVSIAGTNLIYRCA